MVQAIQKYYSKQQFHRSQLLFKANLFYARSFCQPLKHIVLWCFYINRNSFQGKKAFYQFSLFTFGIFYCYSRHLNIKYIKYIQVRLVTYVVSSIRKRDCWHSYSSKTFNNAEQVPSFQLTKILLCSLQKCMHNKTIQENTFVMVGL